MSKIDDRYVVALKLLSLNAKIGIDPDLYHAASNTLLRLLR